MKKGGVSRKVSSSKRASGHKTTKIIHESTKEIKVDRSLTDNFIALQRVMVNLSLKFDSLSTQISKLLELFEISAKNLARKDLDTGSRNPQTSIDVKNIQDKLDNLTSQAGLIGRGLSLIHEVNSEKSGVPAQQSNPQVRPMVTKPVAMPMIKTMAKPFTAENMPMVKPMMQKPGLEEITSELSGYEKSEDTSEKRKERP